jgi:hypothetical protein
MAGDEPQIRAIGWMGQLAGDTGVGSPCTGLTDGASLHGLSGALKRTQHLVSDRSGRERIGVCSSH